MTIRGGTFRQRFFVVANAVFVQERLVNQVFVDQYPGNPRHQGGIATRTDRDPLVFASGCRIGIARVDDNHACVRTLAGLLKIVSNPAAAHARFRRVIAEHHHQFGIFDIRGAVAVVAAVGIRHRAGDLRRAVGAVVAQKTAVAVHQARHQRSVRGGAGDIAADNPGGVINIHRFVAVLADHVFQAGGDDVQRFVPADALELAFTPLTHAFHRVVQTVRVVDAAANRAPAQAGSDLVIAVDILTGVIRFDPVHFVIADVQTQRTAATAVDRTGAPDHFIFCRFHCILYRGCGAFQSKRQRNSASGKRQRTYRRRFHECSTANPAVMFDIGHGSPHHCDYILFFPKR